jgi:hypothetical protein
MSQWGSGLALLRGLPSSLVVLNEPRSALANFFKIPTEVPFEMAADFVNDLPKPIVFRIAIECASASTPLEVSF